MESCFRDNCFKPQQKKLLFKPVFFFSSVTSYGCWNHVFIITAFPHVLFSSGFMTILACYTVLCYICSWYSVVGYPVNKLIEQDSWEGNRSVFHPLDLFCFATNHINWNSVLQSLDQNMGLHFVLLFYTNVWFFFIYAKRQAALKTMHISRCFQSVNEAHCYPVIHAFVVCYTVGY